MILICYFKCEWTQFNHLIETSSLHTDMCKNKSSPQSEESRGQLVDSSKTHSKPGAFNKQKQCSFFKYISKFQTLKYGCY